MDINQAKAILDGLDRFECADYAFGDSEYIWRRSGDDQVVATGYFGGKTAEVSVKLNDVWHKFEGDQARELRKSGILVGFSRNDSLGDDY